MEHTTQNCIPEQHPYVIIIDDDQDDREILSASLELLGIYTKSFDSGVKALSYLHLVTDSSELPTLIISDYNMPCMNGQQVLLSIKTNNATKNIPVVMFSTHLPQFVKKNHLALGALRCFNKPNSYLEFNAQVGVFKDLAYSLMETGETQPIMPFHIIPHAF